MTTEELLAYVQQQDHIVEAHFYVAGGAMRCTHYLDWWDSRLYDEGIDGCRARTSLKQFRLNYPNTVWEVVE